MSKTRIVLEHKDGDIKDTFMKLQELKQMGIADESSLILYYEHFLPAGAYCSENYKSFEDCRKAISNISCDDVYTIWEAGVTVAESLAGCNFKTGFEAIEYWKQYMEDIYTSKYNSKHPDHPIKTKKL